RVERSHKTDDEEFYIPLIPTFKNCSHFLKEAQKWQIYYNTKRPHFGYGMNNLTPLEKLKSLGLTHLNENFANFPVIILDYYSPDYCHLMAGNDVLTKYTTIVFILFF
ncbi:MAG: integrase, partial [candidate division WOR-3 bacterium]